MNINLPQQHAELVCGLVRFDSAWLDNEPQVLDVQLPLRQSERFEGVSLLLSSLLVSLSSRCPSPSWQRSSPVASLEPTLLSSALLFADAVKQPDNINRFQVLTCVRVTNKPLHLD